MMRLKGSPKTATAAGISRVLLSFVLILFLDALVRTHEEALSCLQERVESLGIARRQNVVDQQERIGEMQTELETLRAKAQDAEVSLKQAKTQQEEYMRLADRYNELERLYEARAKESPKEK